MGETITFAYLFNKAWVLLIGLWWYDKKNKDAKEKERDETIQRLVIKTNGLLDEAQVKAIVKEQISPIKEDQQEIKLLLQGLNDNVQSLSKDMAVQNAIRSINSGQQQNNVGG